MPTLVAADTDMAASAVDMPHPPPPAEDKEEAEERPHANDRAVVVVQVVLSAFMSIAFGLTVGYPTFYFVFDALSRTCVDFTGLEGCEAPPHAHCVWTAELGAQPLSTLNGSAAVAGCKYPDYETVYCPQYTDQDECEAMSACVFSIAAGACEHAVGMQAWEAGLFATGQPAGAVVASVAANYGIGRTSLRPALLFSAFLTSLGGIFLHTGRATDAFGVVVLGRFVSGVGAASMRQIGSVMPFVMLGPGQTAGRVTSVLQPFTEFGFLIVALTTFFGVPPDTAADGNIEGIIHGSTAVLQVAVLAVVIALIFLREPPLPKGQRGSVPIPPGGLFLPLLEFPGKLGLLALAPFCFIATGLIGFSVFSPIYSEDAMDIDSSFISLVMQIFGVGFGLLSFPLRRLLPSPRPVFLAGTFVSCAAGIAFGITMSPSVAATAAVRQGVGLTCVTVFYFALECFVGSALFEVGLTLLPPALRGGAAAVLNTVFNIYAAALSFVFPIAIVSLSGGPSGNILEGLSIMFFITGALGIAAGVVLFFWLHPHIPTDAPPTPTTTTPTQTTTPSSAAADLDGVLPGDAATKEEADALELKKHPAKPSN